MKVISSSTSFCPNVPEKVRSQALSGSTETQEAKQEHRSRSSYRSSLGKLFYYSMAVPYFITLCFPSIDHILLFFFVFPPFYFCVIVAIAFIFLSTCFIHLFFVTFSFCLLLVLTFLFFCASFYLYHAYRFHFHLYKFNSLIFVTFPFFVDFCLVFLCCLRLFLS